MIMERGMRKNIMMVPGKLFVGAEDVTKVIECIHNRACDPC